MKDTKNIIIAALIFTLVVMATGYAAFAQQLDLNGTSTITGTWGVEIIDITAGTPVGLANAGTPTFTKTSATFNADLKQPGDSVTYTVTIKNTGTIDAELDTSTYTEGANGSPAIIYTTTDPGQTLAAGQTTTATVTATYDPTTTTVPAITTKTITGIFNYVQAQ